MSRVIAINGSPRKNGNTAILLQKALDGAASVGAETEIVHLVDLNYKGCTSCFACKRKGAQLAGFAPCGMSYRRPLRRP
jgi:multimeric flavodoxin WrbA